MNWFRKILRFFNLLEPGEFILSISKMYMWVGLIAIVYVLLARPDDLVAVMGASGNMFLGTSNYAYRRYMQSKGQSDDGQK